MGFQILTLQLASFNEKNPVKLKAYNAFQSRIYGPHPLISRVPASRTLNVSSALPETAASIAVAATIVGAAATLLVRTTRASDAPETQSKVCEDCGGSGICSECNGEGFVLKRLSDESAEKARLMAQNAATRYTAGLPKKWSYCTKCNAGRSCILCDGSGKLNY